MIIREAGFLMLGSRLKRLGERALAEVRTVYQESGVPFETTWFPIFYVLDTHGPCSIREMSSLLGVSHSAISQLVTQLEKRELVSLRVSADDQRMKEIHLSDQGKNLMKQVSPIWQALAQSFSKHLDPQILSMMDVMEARFDEKSIAQNAIGILHGSERARIEKQDVANSEFVSFVDTHELNIPEGTRGYAAYQGSELVGILSARSSDRITEVHEVFVNPVYRRRGHASALLATLLEDLPDDPICIKRMNSEILQVLAKLNHPFIVQPGN